MPKKQTRTSESGREARVRRTRVRRSRAAALARLVTKQTDPNGTFTEINYVNQRFKDSGITKQDPFGRPGVITSPAVTSTFDGQPHTNQQRTVVTKYFDNDRKVETISDLKLNGDGLLRSRTSSDKLGRLIKTESSENGTSYTITSETVYKYKPGGQNGTAVFTTNPHRSSSDTTDGWTRSTQDVVGRSTEVATFSGSPGTIPPDTGCTSGGGCTGTVTTSYAAEITTVTDQAGRKRSSVQDCLGRLKQVFEDPTGANLATDYGYDSLGNLTTVTQTQQTPAVTQTRTFFYDALSRMTDATNPENGHVVYTYYDNGNLETKTDARSPAVTTTYFYDGLNRVTRRTYSESTPQVDYYYDNQPLPPGAPSFTRGASIGRLVATTYGGASSSTGSYQAYEALGRSAFSFQKTDSQTYSMTYGYDLAGNMNSETYPSGRIMQSDYDNAGRFTSVKRQGTEMYFAGGPIGSGGVQYAAHGAVKVMQLGNGRKELTTFNSRLQPSQIKLDSNNFSLDSLKLDYGYGTTANNGNILSQTITVPSAGAAITMTQSYTYDMLNRLATATENSGTVWSQTYDYDRYGNRSVRSGSYILPANTSITPQSANSTDFSSFNQGTNRLSQTKFPAVLYDGAGNLTRDAATILMTYDAENRLKNLNNGAGEYFYDGDGQRVKKIDSSGTTVFVYNVSGQLIAEYTSGTPAAGDTSYLTTDHLGSTRLVTDSGGNVKARYDYLPFGEEIPSSIGSRSSVPGYGGSDQTRQKFTQKERDNESGLDYFGERYYSSAQGRFTSSDPVIISTRRMANPQLWNGYSYVGNNPLNATDPTGQELVKLGQHTDDEIKRLQKEKDQQLKALKKDDSLTKDQRKEQEQKLKAEKNTLRLEMEGNKVVGALLNALDKTGQRNGLTLKDFTLTTDTKKDFEKYTTSDALKMLVNDQAFVIQGNAQFSGTIYVRTEPAEGFYQLSQRNSDFVYYGASAVRHEQEHLFGRGEGPAYRVQDNVMHGFKNYFQNRVLYNTLDEAFHEAIKKHP